MRKLTKAESGKLGAAKSKIIMAAQKKQRIEDYLKNPKRCKHCDNILEYDSRQKVFCDRSCSATYNNLIRAARVAWTCLGCGTEHTSAPHKSGLYCNRDCFQVARKANTFTRLLNGDISDRATIRSHLTEQFGHTCFMCKLSEWLGKPIPLEVDHVDGNAGNNDYSNLRLLCPNCHGLTDTWKGKNKGNGRAARGLPLN